MMLSSSENQRKLQALIFAPGQILSQKLPTDTILKSLQLRLSGSVQTTYASGTPVADAQSTFDNLCPRVDIIVDGSRVVKSVRPHLMSIQQLMYTQLAAERRSSAGAAAAAGNFPTVDGGFTFGTTTQYTTVAESITIYFEMIWCEPGLGREATYLNLKTAQSAVINITTAAYSALQGFGNTAPVTYGSSTFQIDIYTREAQELDWKTLFLDWKETTKAISFSSQTSSYPIEINVGNKLTGLFLFAQDGAAGSTTTASGKLASNLLIGNMNLVVNGQNGRKATDFQALQAENRTQYGISAPFASNVSRLDGIAHLNLIARRDLTTALDLRRPAVNQCQLFVDTASASVVSYTSPATLTLMQQEIVMPAA